MTEPQMNGPVEGDERFIDKVDPDDPDYIRNHQRPVEIKEDIQLMDSRKRVSLILNSEAFREELEQIVEEQLRQGPHPAGVVALQQLSELLNPRNRTNRSTAGVSNTIIPVADIRGIDSANYSKGEKIFRCKLASLYRLIDLFGWSQGIYNHISLRLNQEQEHFLINPFGMLYNEVTASSLVKIDMQGNVVDQGSTVLGVNKSGFIIHAAVHAARPDIRCVVHLHTSPAVCVSAMKCGLLPISQEAAILGGISYHDYEGIVVDNDEQDRLARNLGPNNKILILRNHGVLVCGATVEEAFYKTTMFMQAADIQMRLAPVGLDNLVQIDAEAAQKTHEVGSKSAGGVNQVDVNQDETKWRPGELEFEAMMRFMDNCGYKTGHLYRQPTIRRPKPQKERATNEVEIPPISSSFMADEERDGKYGTPVKQAMMKQQKKTWLNSPNTYLKQEIDEIGTDSPKKITKWVEDGSGRHEMLATEDPNLFAPQGDNPKELKQKTKEIKKGYFENKKSAGPQSKILEGMTWDEAGKTMDGNRTTETVVVVGAVSKGIIKRDHQHNVAVYKQTYASNPFDNMNPEEVQAYKEAVERKQRGEGDAGPDAVEPDQPASPVTSDASPVLRQRQSAVETSVDDIEPQQNEPSSPVHRVTRTSSGIETNIDDVINESVETSTPAKPVSLRRSDSDRAIPSKNDELVAELKSKTFERSKSDRPPKKKAVNGEGEETPASPAKSDTMRSTDSGELLEDEQGSPTKEPVTDSPSKGGDKHKKKKFRMPSFSKGKKDKKEAKKKPAKESGV